MKKLLLIAALAAAPLMAAAEVHLQIHGFSHHFEERINGEWNEKNLGLGLRWQQSPSFGVQAGFYDNSYSKNTNYLIADWTPVLNNKVGVFGGYGSGYDNKYPLIAGFLYRENVGKASVTLRLVPPISSETSGVVAIEFGWRIK
jgi:hypothetical protein